MQKEWHGDLPVFHEFISIFRETWEAAEPKALAESVDQQRVVPEASIAGTLKNAFRHCHKWVVRQVNAN